MSCLYVLYLCVSKELWFGVTGYLLRVCSANMCIVTIADSGPSRLPSSPSTEGPYATEGTLHLMSSLPRDSGAYRCVAENRLATIVQNTTVTIAEEGEQGRVSEGGGVGEGQQGRGSGGEGMGGQWRRGSGEGQWGRGSGGGGVGERER